MGQEATAAEYDEILAAADAYNVPVEQSFYYPLLLRVVAEVRARKLQSVLEVGCGTGGLAQLLMRETSATYHGFDFSSFAVRAAATRTRRRDSFFQGDALDPQSYRFTYDGIACTEVLEHVKRDLDVVRLWKSGTHCICTVPNFDDPTHVRYFRNEREVFGRYGHLIDIASIVRVPKPLFIGKTLRQYLRQVRWARESPTQMLGLLGVNKFDWHGGWFVFCGLRRRTPQYLHAVE